MRKILYVIDARSPSERAFQSDRSVHHHIIVPQLRASVTSKLFGCLVGPSTHVRCEADFNLTVVRSIWARSPPWYDLKALFFPILEHVSRAMQKQRARWLTHGNL